MTAANNFFTDFYYLAESKGIKVDELIARIGIDKKVIDSPGVRIAPEKLAVLVKSLWDHLQDESMGLSKHPIPRGAFYLMGKAAIHEPNLSKALHLAIQFYSMVTQAYEIEFEENGDVATLKFHMASQHLDWKHLFAEITLMSWHRFMSWLISENITLNQIFFNYPAPKYVSEYAYLFPGKRIFESKFLGFSFKSQFLERGITQTPETLDLFNKRGPVELFMQPKTEFSLSHEVQRVLKKHLRDGLPVIEDAASQLHITKRTLIRKLEEEGTCYQQLKDLVRRDKAIQLLTEQALTLSEIALQVGFSDTAVLSRAFKNWTGVSPKNYRLSLMKGEF